MRFLLLLFAAVPLLAPQPPVIPPWPPQVISTSFRAGYFFVIDQAIAVVDAATPNAFPPACLGFLEVLRNGIDQTPAVDYDFVQTPAGFLVAFRVPPAPGDLVKLRCFRGTETANFTPPPPPGASIASGFTVTLPGNLPFSIPQVNEIIIAQDCPGLAGCQGSSSLITALSNPAPGKALLQQWINSTNTPLRLFDLPKHGQKCVENTYYLDPEGLFAIWCVATDTWMKIPGAPY